MLRIRDPAPLTLEFIPPTLPARDRELEEIFSHVAGSFPKNLFVYGPRGVGKTATLRRFCEEYNRRGLGRAVYVPFRRTVSATWEALFPDAPGRKRGEALLLKAVGERGVIVFDEVQDLYRKADLSFILFTLHESMRGVPVILVSVMSLFEFQRSFLSESVASRYQFHPLIFRAYNREEIKMILRQRLELAAEGGWEEDALEFIAGKVERHGSDMRLGVRLLANAVRIAVERGSDLTLQAAEEAWEEEKVEFWESEYLAMHPHQALLLYSIFLLLDQKGSATTSEAYMLYNRTCSEMGVKPMTRRQLSSYINNLERAGFITVIIEMIPRGGKVARIESDLQPKIMVEAGARALKSLNIA